MRPRRLALIAILVLTGDLPQVRAGEVLVYDFENATPEVVPDESGNGHEGMGIPSAEIVDGPYGRAMRFPVQGGITISNAPALYPTPFAMELRVLMEQETGILISNRNEFASPEATRELRLTEDGVAFVTSDCETDIVLEAVTEVPIGEWVLLGAMWDGRELVLYKDRQRLASRDLPSLCTADTHFRIGRSLEMRDFLGTVDDVRFFDEVIELSAPDPAQNLYGCRVGSSGGGGAFAIALGSLCGRRRARRRRPSDDSP